MKRLWILYCFLLLGLSGCGRKLPKIPEGSKFTDWTSAALEADQVTFDFILWLTWAGLACVVIGVVWLLWGTRKDIGVRIIFTGFAFNLVAKAITFYEQYEWLVWLTLFGCMFIYACLNPRRVEKVLAKIGIYIDIDGDDMIGTGRTAKKAGEKFFWFFRRKAVNQDDIETDRIDKETE